MPLQRRQLITAALPLAAGCAGPPHGAPATGIDPALQARLAEAGSDGSNTHAVLVQRGAQTLAELYFAGTDRPAGSWWPRSVAFDADTPHDQRSVTKSVVGLLAGIQHGRGVLAALDTPVLHFFPEHRASAGAALQALQLQHLLDMTTGWQWDELSLPYTHPANPDARMAAAADLPAFAFGLPFDHAPGTRFTYCGVAPRLLAEVLQRASGQSLRTLADETLFGPLGIANPPWGTGRDGSLRGDSGLLLTPRQMARIGRLMLDGGRTPQGRQVVPAGWIAATFAQRVPASAGMGYGRFWWHGRFAAGPGANIAFTTAIGNGGQRIAVVPSLDAVVVITAGRYNQPDNGVPSSRLLRTVLAHLATIA